MIPYMRRVLFVLLWLGLVLPVRWICAADGVPQNWSSRVIRLQPNDALAAPPVVTAISLQRQRLLLATAGDDHLVRVWDAATGGLVYRLDEHADWVRAVAYSPDGAVLATGGNDRRIVLWDAASGRKRSVLAHHEEAITHIVFSPDGSLLAAAGFGEKLRVYEMQREQLRQELLCPCRDMRAAAFSPDGRLLAAGGRSGTIRLWDSRDGSHLRDLPAHRRRIRRLLFTADGQRIISCGEDRVVRISSVKGGESFALPRRPAKVLAMTLYAPGRLATGGTDNLIRLWDLDARSEIGRLSGHTGSVAALASQGDTLVSGSYDTTVRIWKIRRSVAEGAGAPAGRVGSADGKDLK